MKLSPRLELIFRSLIPGLEVWDICCDHGLVGKKALMHGGFPKVHFVDQVPHIMEKLRARLDYLAKRHNTEKKWELYSSPAQEISSVISGNVVVAGIGGRGIIEILRAHLDKDCFQAQRLVLGPQDHWQELEAFLRSSLHKNMVTHEIDEKHRPRKIFVLDF